jgi:hypothetical protein
MGMKVEQSLVTLAEPWDRSPLIIPAAWAKYSPAQPELQSPHGACRTGKAIAFHTHLL